MYFKAKSRSQGKIAQSPKDTISVQIIRVSKGIGALKIGHLDFQEISPITAWNRV